MRNLTQALEKYYQDTRPQATLAQTPQGHLLITTTPEQATSAGYKIIITSSDITPRRWRHDDIVALASQRIRGF